MEKEICFICSKELPYNHYFFERGWNAQSKNNFVLNKDECSELEIKVNLFWQSGGCGYKIPLTPVSKRYTHKKCSYRILGEEQEESLMFGQGEARLLPECGELWIEIRRV